MGRSTKNEIRLARLFPGLTFLHRKKKESDMQSAATEADLKIPVHLGVIMDGNGRWAQERHLPRSAGHRAGAENLKELCRNCGYYGVRYLTVYAFSTENWSRPDDEVHALMELFVEFFERYDPEGGEKLHSSQAYGSDYCDELRRAQGDYAGLQGNIQRSVGGQAVIREYYGNYDYRAHVHS